MNAVGHLGAGLSDYRARREMPQMEAIERLRIARFDAKARIASLMREEFTSILNNNS